MPSITNLGVRWLLITGLDGPKPRIITKLSPAKQNYDIYNKELLAIVAALET